jgi:hypothetical protein
MSNQGTTSGARRKANAVPWKREDRLNFVRRAVSRLSAAVKWCSLALLAEGLYCLAGMVAHGEPRERDARKAA